MQDELTTAIANDLGITHLTVDEQKKLIAQFGEIALKSATLAVVEKLSPKMREEFAKLAEAGDALALKTFLDAEISEHDNIVKSAVAEEVKRFRDFQKP
jgi:hypothetical protein